MSNLRGFQGRLNLLIQRLAGGKEKAFAKLLDIKPENINKWTNRGSLPSAEQLENIAGKLNININWLLSGEGDINTAKTAYPAKPTAQAEDSRPKKKKIYWEESEVSLAETGARLKGIRGGLSIKQAADVSGVSAAAIKNCEAGKQQPDVQYLYWAAGYGHTNATWIMTGDNPREERVAAEERPRYGQPITPDERDLLDMYRSAPKEAREAVKALLKIYGETKKR